MFFAKNRLAQRANTTFKDFKDDSCLVLQGKMLNKLHVNKRNTRKAPAILL